MSSKIPALPPITHASAPAPVKASPKPTSAAPVSAPPRPAERHPSSALSAADVGYVDSLMGFAPPQVMETIMLKTGVPMPENLGQDIDTSA